MSGKSPCLSLALFLALGALSLGAAVRLVSPVEGETVSQLRPLQTKVVRESKAEAYFRNLGFTKDEIETVRNLLLE